MELRNIQTLIFKKIRKLRITSYYKCACSYTNIDLHYGIILRLTPRAKDDMFIENYPILIPQSTKYQEYYI